MQADNKRGRLRRWLYEPEDAGSLALFRIGFGVVMAWGMWRYLSAVWVQKYFFSDIFLFKYPFFEWVHPLPPPAMWVVLWGSFIAALGVCFGVLYRLCAPLLFIGHTYLFLLAASHYLNHSYLISVLALIMSFLPAHRAISVDSWLWPSLRSSQLPRWPHMLLIFQVGIVYFFAGIAKLNTDWLFYRQPIQRWLESAARHVPVGKDLVGSEAASYTIAWGGCAYDLLAVPALLWPPTRFLATVTTVAFHLSNTYLFNIGVFPWMMLAIMPVFFPAGWYRQIPGLGLLLGQWVDCGAPPAKPSLIYQRVVTSVLATWVVFQLFLPLRHHLYPGNVAWTEEGHKYAWRMKLRSKRGVATFRILDPKTGEAWLVDPKDELTARQLRKLPGQPELLLQYAHHLDKRYRQDYGVEDPQVFGEVSVSLNYRPHAQFIDPAFDLSTQTITFAPFPWILPLEWTPPPKD
ncbi:MAG: HTTM domain-containing protein [Myxococcales bacterium]|nr:HTTM domain-containing protein [Myxococcales bacterium]